MCPSKVKLIYKGGVSKKEKEDYANAIRRNVIEAMQVGEKKKKETTRVFQVAATIYVHSGNHTRQGRLMNVTNAMQVGVLMLNVCCI